MNIPFTQTKEYLKWHEAIGTKTFYLEFFRDISESVNSQIDGESEKEKYVVAACVIINLRIGKVLYIPYGPVFFGTPIEEEKNKVVKKLHEVAIKENCVFVRLEDENNYLRNIKYLISPSKKTFSKEGIFQPRMEWWLDITESEDEILNRIHKDHKYSIRRAQKENIQIKIVDDIQSHSETFWMLMQETADRDGFILHDKKYYDQIIRAKSHELKKFFVFAYDVTEEGLVRYWSGALIVISDKIANLVFAGSVSEGREKGFNHLMQWSAIQEAKKHGCEIYNFGGITEDGYGKQTLEGVTKFKRKFGGYAKFHGDFLDMPIKKLKYFAYILRKMLY